MSLLNTKRSCHVSAAKDPFVQDRLTKVANGSISAQAPAGTDNINWTEADEQRLDAALTECLKLSLI